MRDVEDILFVQLIVIIIMKMENVYVMDVTNQTKDGKIYVIKKSGG